MESITRRAFLQHSTKAAGGAAVGLTILKSRNSAYAANDRIGVAVVGIHGRGQSHMDAYLGIDGVRVIALCDPDTRLFDSRAKKVRDKQGHTPRCYADRRA